MSNLISSIPKITKKKAKRLGRGYGSGRGAKSTRGTKRHQKAKTKIPLFFEGGQNPITKRLPLLRGKLKNKSIKQKPFIIKLKQLSIYKNQEEVNSKSLFQKGIIKKKLAKNQIKLLGQGKINKSLIINIPTSAKAKLKIEKAKGKVI